MPDNRSALLLRFAVLLWILGLAACDAAKPGADASLEAASPAVFESRRVIETAATGIAASAAADLSGDRRLDLVVAPRDVNELWIFVGSRAAGFAEKPTVVLPLDRSVTRVLVADLDGDRDEDLVCVLGDRILQVFDNDGYGRFTEQPPELLAEPVVDIVGGDFDQDGVDDFVLAMSAAIEVWTQRDGRHRRTLRIDLDAQTSLSAACVAWIDGDAYPDLAVTDAGRNEVLVWHGSAHGIDGQRRLLLGLPGSDASALCAGDVTGDASTDLVVIVQGAANLVVFAGNGLGNFEPATLFEVQGLARSLWLARFTPASAERIVIGFADRTELAVVEAKPFGAFGAARHFACSGRVTGLAVLDIDDDERMDLVTSSSDGGGIGILRSHADGFAATETFAASSVLSSAVADFDDDGDADVVTCGGTEDLCEILVGQRGQPRERVVARRVDVPGRPKQLVAADFDHDGRMDVLVMTAMGLRILVNRSSTQAIAFDLWPAASEPAIDVGAGPDFDVVCADFDRDGGLDVAVLDRTAERVNLLFGQVLRLGFRYERATIDVAATSVAHGDLDGDGIDDLVFALRDGRLRVHHGDGRGGFAAAFDHELPLGFDRLNLADLDREAGLEVVAWARGRREVAVHDGRDAAAFRILGLRAPLTSLLVHDVNVDGRRDLVVANEGDTLEILLGDGRGGFFANDPVPAVRGATMLVAGDFDGDGRSDLLLGEAQGARVALLRSLR